jgi:DtxR family Mn-dependent transcriptional regulator
MRTNSFVQKLSSAKEDYIRAIYLLNSHDIDATVTDIAKKLNLRKSTVSEGLKDLVTAGLVIAPLYGKVTLTATGTKIGERITFKHRLIEVFLYETLKMPIDSVHAEAEILEHALSDTVAEKLSTYLNQPTHDPHGSKIPKL